MALYLLYKVLRGLRTVLICYVFHNNEKTPHRYLNELILHKHTRNNLPQGDYKNQNVEEQHESTRTLARKRSKPAWLNEYQLYNKSKIC